MRLSSCIGSWLKWLHKAGGLWERWCRDSIFLPAHNCTMIIQCEHISPSSVHVSISAFDWWSSVLCISHLMSLYMLIRMVFFVLLTMTTLTPLLMYSGGLTVWKWKQGQWHLMESNGYVEEGDWKNDKNATIIKKRKGDRIKTEKCRKGKRRYE